MYGRGVKVDTAGKVAAKAPYVAKLQNHLSWQGTLDGEIHHVCAAILEIGIVLKA